MRQIYDIFDIMIHPTLRQLQYIVALNSEGSFSKAAETCYVTQSTLSAGIKELETILGLTLVDRKSRKVSFTAAGEEILGDAEDILKRVENMTGRIKTMGEPMSGPLRLGVIPTIAPYLLPKILSPLGEKFPKLEIRLYEDLTERLLQQLREGRIDIALIAFPYDLDAMDHDILFEEPFLLACPAANPRPKSALTLDDLDSENLLLLEDGHCLRDHALKACKLQAPGTRKTFSASSLPTLIQMVAHGYGSTLLPEMIAENELPNTVKLIPFKTPKPTRQIGLTWMSGSHRANDFKLLAKTMKNLL